jgi:Mrp family chromosome partitioning ATPase
VSNTAQVISARAEAETANAAPSIPAYLDLSMPAAGPALVDSEGIRVIAEPVAAVARLTGHSRVLIAACRTGDGASTVASALALDLAIRLGVDTLLIDADPAGGVFAEAKTGGNGRPVRINQSGTAHLWTAHCAKIPDPVRSTLLPANGERADQDVVVEELRQAMARYRAVVVDLGVVRLDARMLAMARPDDPVLVVARYGCSRRDELAATLAVVNVANCRIGGVILNGYESPAIDRLQWIPGVRQDGR